MRNIFGIPYMWNLKRNDTDEFTKQKQTQTSRTNLWLKDERACLWTEQAEINVLPAL